MAKWRNLYLDLPSHHDVRDSDIVSKRLYGNLAAAADRGVRKARGIAARHAAFGGYAVDPDMALGGGEASGVAGHVVAVRPR
jgi:hypothetical protein